jgi:SAM-dependent methyltransferase
VGQYWLAYSGGMSQGASYRDSHSVEGKGEQYESYYANDPWQAFMWAREQACIDELLREHLAGREIKLLDFACGTGRITSYLETRVGQCVGIDVSTPMLEQARQRLHHTELIDGDLTQGDVLGGRKFDLITAFRFFTNAEDQLRRKVIRALADHLDTDGYLLFNNHHIPSAMYFRSLELIARVKGRPLDSDFRMMTMDETQMLIREAGLHPVACRRVGFLHLPRMNFPVPLLDAAESLASRVGWLARHCESVMVLCKR